MTNKKDPTNKDRQARFRAKKKAQDSEAIALLKEILAILKENTNN